jgi:hypothetical protein
MGRMDAGDAPSGCSPPSGRLRHPQDAPHLLQKEGEVSYLYGKEGEAEERIINHLKLTFVASKPPPPRIAYQELLMAAEDGSEYFS